MASQSNTTASPMCLAKQRPASLQTSSHTYDLKITLEDGMAPLLGPVYSLSQEELKALCKFIDENVAMGFITPSHSSHRAPVLFIKKNDGSLRLCINFWGINRITKKDQYPLPLISDLLDAPCKAHIYTKIDLQHAYHLVHIAAGDKNGRLPSAPTTALSSGW